MAQLTDLPNEILEHVFRQLLSQKLTDHGHMCEWQLEEDAGRARATLYSLAMVSKALSRIALPLLYEQLFDDEDLEKFLVNKPRLAAVQKYLPLVRYLYLSFDGLLDEAERCTTLLLMGLTHCLQVQHMHVAMRGNSMHISTFLLKAARLQGMQGLQSLSIFVIPSDAQHSMFRDVCYFSGLKGLEIIVEHYEAVSIGGPEQTLENLKYLRADYYGGHKETAACMALVQPASLERLKLYQHELPSSVGRIVQKGAVWIALEDLELDTSSSLMLEMQEPTRFPALKQLLIYTHIGAQLKQLLGTLPANLSFLELGGLNTTHLADIFNLIKTGNWLRGAIQTIVLKLDNVDLLSEAFPLDEEAPTKAALLSLAQEAVLAARSATVVLEPDDLVSVLEGLEVWEHEQ